MTREGEWIEHNGRAEPDLPADAQVEIRLRGYEMADDFYGNPENLDWTHSKDMPESDIVAYRVVPHE